jgi:regulatory protein YycI of two-component signal transduction system YycFG
MKTNHKDYFFNTMCIIIIILFIINIFLFYVYTKKTLSISENFSDNTINEETIDVGMQFQTGIGSTNSSGTITFNKPFTKNPIVLTQIIGSSSTLNNVYSIQIFNITNTSFNYSKNKVFNNVTTNQSSSSSNSAFIVPTINPSDTENFVWFAFR